MKQSELFGTDGIRGRWPDHPLDPETLKRIGRVLGEEASGGRILFANDTRESASRILEALWRGIGSRAAISYAGVLPTAAVAFLTRQAGFDLGVMITASHNPWQDNGIKIFNRRGEKLPDRKQLEIERRVKGSGDFAFEIFRAHPCEQKNLYSGFLASQAQGVEVHFGEIVFDCANGATHRVVPELFGKLQGKLTYLNINPGGRNINLECGSEHIAAIREAVVTRKAALGVAFDGDGDRVLFVTPDGSLISGELVLYLLARQMKKANPRFNGRVVSTVLCNGLLQEKLSGIGGRLLLSAVGDRHVWQLMKKERAGLGGEPSGHIIIGKLASCGDGILTTIFFLRALRDLELTPAELLRDWHPYPQYHESIPVQSRRDLSRIEPLQSFLREKNALPGVRAIVRYSGTENKIRLFMEDASAARLEKNSAALKALVLEELGSSDGPSRERLNGN